MAEPIGALRALLSASAGVFESDMKQARNAVRKNTNDMQNAFDKLSTSANSGVISSIGRLRKEVVALASVSVLFAATKRAIDFADSIDEISRQLGFGAEAFQEYKYAATQNGVATEGFESSLKRYTKTVGDAKRESKGAVDLFRQMGISIDEVRKSSPEQLLSRVADKFKEIKDPATRASLALELFGKGGLGFADFLSKGSKEIDTFRQRARDLGIVLSADVVEQAAAAKDELDTMSEVLKVAGVNIALQFLPAMRELAKLVTDPAFIGALGGIATALEKTISLIHNAYPEIISLTLAFTALAVASKKGAINQGLMLTILGGAVATEATLRFRKNMHDAAAANGELSESTSEAGESLEDFAGGLDLTSVDLGKLTRDLVSVNSHLENMIRLTSRRGIVGVSVGGEQDFASQTKSFTEHFNRVQDGYDLINEAAKQNINLTTEAGNRWYEAALKNRALQRSLSDTQKVLEDIKTPLQAYREETGTLNDLLTAGHITQDQYNRALDNARDRFSSNTRNVRGLAAAGKEMGDAFGDALGKMIEGTESFGDTLRNLGRQLASSILQKAILAPIADTLSTGFSNFVGSFGGARAGGGRVSAGRTYLVGEKGPELRTDLGTGTIIPNEALGMGGNTYYIDATGADQGAVNRLQAALLQLAGPGVVERRTKEAMQRGQL